MDFSTWPALNATLNATSALLLIAALWCIRVKKIAAHAGLMVTACLVSTLFLISYVLYHVQVGSVHFLGTGWVRPAYFALLITHTVLAVTILPLVVRTLFLAIRHRFVEHVAIARWTFPLWLFVCVSGIVVYYLLYWSRWAA